MDYHASITLHAHSRESKAECRMHVVIKLKHCFQNTVCPRYNTGLESTTSDRVISKLNCSQCVAMIAVGGNCFQ